MDYNTAPPAQPNYIVQELPPQYTLPDAGLDNLIALTATLCQVPAAALLFTNGHQLCIKTVSGLSVNDIVDADTLGAAVYRQKAVPGQLNSLIVEHRIFASLGHNSLIAYPLPWQDNDINGYVCIPCRDGHYLTGQQQEMLSPLAKQFALDITSRQQQLNINTNAAQHISREQIKYIFERTVDAVVITDQYGTITQWNPRAENTFGWKEEEAMGQNFETLCLPAESNARFLQYKESCGNSNQLTELIALHKNGSELIIRLGLSCLTYNAVNYCIMFMGDVTEHQQITNRLDKQKAFYENILNKLPTDIAVFDANHRYLFVNPGAIGNPEYRKAIIGKDDYEYAAYRGRDATVADKRRSQFLEVKKTGQEIRWEDGLRAPDGKLITHLRRMFPVHNKQGELKFVIGFGMDITDRIALEEKQSMMVKQLSAQNTQLVDFCNIVSHNLRGPLVNMSMLVQFIKDADDAEEQQFLISKLQPVIDNLHTTFNELVESIQIKQDVGIISENINLDDCVQRTLAGFEMEIKKTGAVIETNFKEAGTLYYPSKYLFSIFYNLIDNALKYSAPARQPHICITTTRNDDNVLLSVADNGLGLDTNKHKDSLFKIGKVFHRHPNAKGFGLFMTKTQVEAMDGRIWVESTPGEGTTFFVEFKKQPL